MTNSYEGMEKFCSKLERIAELEKLMTGEGQNPIVNSVMLPLYQSEHNRLTRSVNHYLSKNYPDGSFAVVLDIWQYMQEQQREKVSEAVLVQSALVEKEREAQEKKRDELVAKIEDFRAFLREHYQIKGSEG